MLPCPQESFLLSMYSKGNSRDNVELKLKNTVEQENGHFVTPQYILRTNLWVAGMQPEGSMGAQPSSAPGSHEPIYLFPFVVDVFL